MHNGSRCSVLDVELQRERPGLVIAHPANAKERARLDEGGGKALKVLVAVLGKVAAVQRRVPLLDQLLHWITRPWS